MDIFICVDCDVEFAYDESPSDERCAECASRRAYYFDTEDVA